MDKKSLETVLNNKLVPNGFKKKASAWYRQVNGMLQVVDLQKSAYGLQFFLNLCCVPAGMEVEGMPTPKEHKCPIRIRLTAAYPEQRTQIEESLDLERTGLADSMRQAALGGILEELVLPFCNNFTSVEVLRDAIQRGLFKRGAINGAAQGHLNLNEPTVATLDSPSSTPRG